MSGCFEDRTLSRVDAITYYEGCETYVINDPIKWETLIYENVQLIDFKRTEEK